MNPRSTGECMEPGAFQLRFRPLSAAQRSYAFPCDAAGYVDLDSLGEPHRTNYLYARALIGREFSSPRVQPCTTS